ncbi:MAG: AlpA family phage regulatory protein [Mesorhizobium sp.]|uniref:helix-turn-helix transcriptional regulator n=1 Tax=Mesorhizobium sp. TaxID=1871066 RepID=UPI000FE9161A|nr:AlpA family phage regulatory protein [Mesorhizobium sp.]RWM96168.1 MAG: AlpA family phage regulatory protein [Mesorhizobium sp.]
MSDNTTILSVQTVCDRLTISEATLRRYATAGGDFPRKIKLGPRRIGYLKSDVEAWLTARHDAAKAAVGQ